MTTDDKTPFRIIPGGKNEDTPPINDYAVLDIEGNEFFASGFLIFTSHHLAVMNDLGNGPVTVLLLPLHRVKVCEVMEEDEDSEDAAPF